jgi:peptidoglycan/xylan/chitin deacetylase (PgdA/CDA1 family)
VKNKIRNINAKIISFLFIALGLSGRVKRKALRGDFILSIYFHSPEKALFEFCIKWLKKNDFHFLSEKEIVAIAKNVVPFPKGGVILTVDDGWLSNEKNVIALAEKNKVPVTIFVATDAIENGNYWWPYVAKAHDLKMDFPSIEELKSFPNKEREKILKKVKAKVTLERQALSLKQLKKAANSKYITIGAHTVHHPILTNCEDDEAYLEIKQSKNQIESWLKTKVGSFAYPNGDYTKREIEYLKQLDFFSAYTTEPEYLTKEKLQKIYQLPRFCIYEGVSKQEAICRMTGIWQRFFKGS